jgi:quinol monooxygenase YgiN
MQCRYKDKAAFAAHASSKEMQNFQKVLRDEDLLQGPFQLKRVKTVGGFSSRI